jgi:hypothetical protein
MKYGECIINEKWNSSLGAKEGSIVYMKIQAFNMYNAIINKFNNRTNSNIRKINSRDSITIPCRVKKLTSSTDGKYT